MLKINYYGIVKIYFNKNIMKYKAKIHFIMYDF